MQFASNVGKNNHLGKQRPNPSHPRAKLLVAFKDYILFLKLNSLHGKSLELRKIGMEVDGDSPFYANQLEDIEHLFMQCSFVNEVWYTIAKYCPTSINGDLHFLDMIDLIYKYENVYYKRYDRPLKKMLVIVWSIWAYRDNTTFIVMLNQFKSLISLSNYSMIWDFIMLLREYSFRIALQVLRRITWRKYK